MDVKRKEMKERASTAVKRAARFLWKQKMLIPAVLVGVFVCGSLYSYEKPEFRKVDAAVAGNQDGAAGGVPGDGGSGEIEKEDEDKDKKEEDSASGEGFDLEDGVYQGSGTGYGGTVTVKVTIKDKKIEGISIVSAPGEGDSFLKRAKGVIDAMIKGQRLDVDAVSGATYSSRGIIEAVKNAITGEKPTSTAAAPASASARTGSPAPVGTVKENQTYKDGTYTGSGQGFGGTIKVQVTIKKGKIKTIKIVSASGETKSYFDKAKKLTKTIIKKQSTNVDAVSGATYSSNGIIKAVRNALSKAKTSKAKKNKDSKKSSKNSSTKKSSSKPAKTGKLKYPDGVYYGTGEGFSGDITVAITIRDYTLKSAVITQSSDDESYLSKAKSILDAVVTKQSADVDAVSGATYSSKGIIEAVKNALNEAKKAAKKVAFGSGESDQNKEDADNKDEDNKDENNKEENTDNKNPDQETPDISEEEKVYNDGTYTGSALCTDGDAFYYTLKVNITVKDDKIVSAEVVESSDVDWKENEAYIKRAGNKIMKSITSKGAPEGIDAVSGATYSSKALIKACQDAFAKAKK